MRLLSLTFALATAVAVMAEEQPVTLTLKPSSLEISQRLQIDDKGRARQDSGSLNLQFNAVTGPASVTVSGYSRVTFTEVVTDSGETLKQSQNDTSVNRIDPRMRQYQPGVTFSGYVQFSPPRKPAKRITLAKGTIDLALAEGKTKSAEIKPIKDFIGKRLQIEGVEGVEITISEHRDDQIELTMPRSTEQQLADVSFTDAAGVACQTQGGGGNSRNGILQRSYRVTVPDDGAMVLQFHAAVRTVTVPFTITDIPLPGATEADKPADAVIKAREVPEKAKPEAELKVKAEGEF